MTTYTVHLKLTGKLVVDLLLVLIELFSLGATSEYSSEIGVFEWGWAVLAKFSHRRKRLPQTVSATLRWQFSHKETL